MNTAEQYPKTLDELWYIDPRLPRGVAMGSNYQNLYPQGTPVLLALALPANQAMHVCIFLCSQLPGVASGCKLTACNGAYIMSNAQRGLVSSASHRNPVWRRELCHFLAGAPEFSPRPLYGLAPISGSPQSIRTDTPYIHFFLRPLSHPPNPGIFGNLEKRAFQTCTGQRGG